MNMSISFIQSVIQSVIFVKAKDDMRAPSI